MTSREITKLIRSGWPVFFNDQTVLEAKTVKGDVMVRVAAGWFVVSHPREVRAATSVAISFKKGAL